MREYLFRGKRVDNGEWVEGSLIHQGDFCCILQDEEQVHSMDFPYLSPEFGVIDGRVTPVIPESVGEWTGIYDINKRKIFENDIVRTQPFTDRPYSSRAKSKQHIGVVEYCMPELRGDHFKQRVYDARWRVNVKDYGKYVCSNWSDFFNCEVIGNVFDNADLLEG